MVVWPQVIVLFLLVAGQGAAAVGEVGGPPNECYAMMPTDLPITISYSKSSSTSATSFTFLVNVRIPTVTAFGIRLNNDLAVMSSRISGTPEGQLVPQGPAFIWTISHTGLQVFVFTVNTTGLTTGSGPNSMPDLSDICAQGIQIADDTGKLIWQQPSPASTCVSWVKQGDNCTYQTIRQNSAPSLSPKLDFPMYYSPHPAIAYTAPVASPASSPPIYGGYHSSPAPASPFSPMASPASPLFGIQSNSAAYSPAQVASPRAVAYSPAPGGYYSPAAQRSPRAGATPLFGTPTPSPPPTQLTQYSPPAPYLPQGYGAAPSSPALTPRFTPKPYYTITAGVYGPAPYSSSSRSLLSTQSRSAPGLPGSALESALASAHLFGTRQLLSTLPAAEQRIRLDRDLIGQQSQPAGVQQSCAHCFKKRISDIQLHVNASKDYKPAANATTYIVKLTTANASMSGLDSVSLRVPSSALNTQLTQQLGTLDGGCDGTNLQSSLKWNRVRLIAGEATLKASVHGGSELLQDEIIVVDESSHSLLQAEGGTAVITVRNENQCYFQIISV